MYVGLAFRQESWPVQEDYFPQICNISVHLSSRDTDSFWSSYIFPRMFIQGTTLKTEMASTLESRACSFTLEYNKGNISLWSSGWTGLLAAHYKILGFLKFGVSQL